MDPRLMLSRDAILGFKDDRIGKVDIPELGGEVCIASFNVAEMDRIARLDGSTPASVECVILGACDEDGKRLFTDKDREALKKLPARVVSDLAKAIFAHNGLGAEAEEPKNA